MTGERASGGSTPVAPDDAERARILNRLRRLEGQIRGLQTMVESGQDCDAIMTQVMAAKSALNRVGLHIIGHSMKTCISVPESASRDEVVDEALAVFLRFVNLPEAWGTLEDGR